MPEVGARDQYIPDDGAARTSGAVLGFVKGGKGVKTSAPLAGWPRPVPTRGWEGAAWLPPGGRPPLVMAEVERRLVGLRGWVVEVVDSLPLPAEAPESPLSRPRVRLTVRLLVLLLSPFSVMVGWRDGGAELGVGALLAEGLLEKEVVE